MGGGEERADGHVSGWHVGVLPGCCGLQGTSPATSRRAHLLWLPASWKGMRSSAPSGSLLLSLPPGRRMPGAEAGHAVHDDVPGQGLHQLVHLAQHGGHWRHVWRGSSQLLHVALGLLQPPAAGLAVPIRRLSVVAKPSREGTARQRGGAQSEQHEGKRPSSRHLRCLRARSGMLGRSDRGLWFLGRAREDRRPRGSAAQKYLHPRRRPCRADQAQRGGGAEVPWILRFDGPGTGAEGTGELS